VVVSSELPELLLLSDRVLTVTKDNADEIMKANGLL
jgi:ABC-type sugar transport system ATPase subunit